MITIEDQSAYNIAVASVRRHSMDIHAWKRTTIGELHHDIGSAFQLQPGELVIASGYFSDDDWWAVTTRRVVSMYDGTYTELDPRYGIEARFGHFKGTVDGGIETAEVMSPKLGLSVRFRFETRKPSMAPIYACKFWSRTSRFHYATNNA